MRISIKYDEQPGLLLRHRTDIYLAISVDFSEEEKSTIRQRRLEANYIRALRLENPKLRSPRISPTPLSSRLPLVGQLLERQPYVTVRELLIYGTFIYKFDDASYAKYYEGLVRASLAEFKDQLIDNRDVGRDDVYDL